MASTFNNYNNHYSKLLSYRLLFLYSQILLQLPVVIHLLSQQLLLEVRMSQHVVLTESVHLVVSSLHRKSAVLDNLYRLDLLRELFVDHLLHSLLPPFGYVGTLQLVLQFVKQFFMHEVPVHVLL